MVVAATASLELRAVNLGDVAAELSKPTLTPGDLHSWPSWPSARTGRSTIAISSPSAWSPEDNGSSATAADRWRRLQELVARSIAERRRVTIEPDVSRYVSAVIRHHSYWWDELAHPVHDGPAFRQALTDDVADVLGTELVAQLVRRPFLGLVSDAHPYFGWSSNQELRPIAARFDGPAGTPRRMNRETDSGALRAFRTCLSAAADRQLDLVTIYDVDD